MKTKRSKKPQQQAFEFFKKRIVKTFGGQLLERKRKSKRSLSTKSAIHLVVKSEKAKGSLSFVNHQSVVVKIAQFFTLRPWTRILHWGRDFTNVLEYLILNKMEVVGLRPAKKFKSEPSQPQRPPD